MSKASRRWEKSAPTGAPTQSQSPLSTITSFVDSLNADERASHRAAYLHLMQALTGASVHVDHFDGVKLDGVLHTITPFEGQSHAVVLKGCKVQQRDASAGPSASDGKTAVFPFEKVVTLQNTAKLELVSRNYSTEFATDSSIKKHGDMSHLEGRNLKSVDNSWLQPGNDMSLEGKSGSGKSWDQFETNRRLFNVKDTYDENLYTKKLDLKSMTSEQIAMADRLAREIEGTASSNIHLQEERGQAPEGDWDEEDRFSGVLKEAPAVKKAAPEVNNPWKRGAKLTGAAVVAGTASAGASGAASPATPATLSNSASATSISGKAPLTPPPGVTKKPATATNTAVPAEAAPKKIEEEKGSDKANKAEKTDKPAEKTSDKTEKVEKKAEPVTDATTAPVAAADKADKPVDAATPEAKPAPVKKLNAAAAEFKPAWMTAAAPAPAVVAPATPVAPSTPQQSGFVPQQQFTPSHNHYNSPDVYNKAPHTPNYVPHGPAEGYGGFDPNVAPMGMLPPQYIPGTPPMMYDPNAPSYFMPPQMQPMVMDYVPNMNGMMPMPMMPVQGMQGMPMQGMPGMPYPPMQQQGMPMHDGGMYMPQNMGFQPNMNMNMGMMQQQQQPNHQMGGMYPPQQGYNNNGMGSGQKSKFNNNNNNGNGDIRNSANKGGRGMGGRGYNNNMGGGRGYGNSPQHGGMPPPSGPGGDNNVPDSA